MRFREDPLEAALVIAKCLLSFFLADVTAADERFGVELAHRALGLDQGVHHRLRHRGIVALIVAAAAVAHHVDDDVLVEPLAVVEGQLGHPDNLLRIVTVHVEDRCLDHLGDVGGVHGGARRRRSGGEANLVVHDHVDRAAGAVAAQLGEVQRFGHHSLAREGCVAVDEDRQDGELVAAVQPVLLGADDAFEDGVAGLKVGRVRGKVDLCLVAVV